MDYKKAIDKLTSERRAREAEAHILYLELMRTIPELYETEKAIRAMRMDRAASIAIDEDAFARLVATRDDILKKHGVTKDMLEPPYKCDKCRDTGLYHGKPCSCVISACLSEGINPGAKFDVSNIECFPPEERERVASVYVTAKAFCDKFPSTNKLNLLFMGRCGSGKTFIASCIANDISAKGHSVVMLSAFAFTNRMLKYHTTFDDEKLSYLEPLLDCNLLIIDDLGTENMLKNVTAEYLFLVINERMTAGKHTIFTTNLDDGMIRARYGERVYSRLFGSKVSKGFALSNSDLRNN